MARVEAARGDMSCYVVGDGGANAYRARFRTGIFNAMGIIREKSRGPDGGGSGGADRVARRRGAGDRSMSALRS